MVGGALEEAAAFGVALVDRERAVLGAALERHAVDRLRVIAGHVALDHVLQHARGLAGEGVAVAAAAVVDRAHELAGAECQHHAVRHRILGAVGVQVAVIGVVGVAAAAHAPGRVDRAAAHDAHGHRVAARAEDHLGRRPAAPAPGAAGIGQEPLRADQHGEALLVELDAVAVQQAAAARRQQVDHAVMLGQRRPAAAHQVDLVDVLGAAAPPVPA